MSYCDLIHTGKLSAKNRLYQIYRLPDREREADRWRDKGGYKMKFSKLLTLDSALDV